MQFDESEQNRKTYASYLYQVIANLNIDLLTKKQKKNKDHTLKNLLWIWGYILVGFPFYYATCIDPLPKQGQEFIIKDFTGTIGLYLVGVLIGSFYLVVLTIRAMVNQPRDFVYRFVFKHKKVKQSIDKSKDIHLIDPKYILLTYMSADDKAKHKDEIAQIARNNPHKKVVVYVLPYRAPYIVRFDEYVFCFAVKDGKMQLLGIVQDNKDHTMPAILAQAHKVGPLMKGEEVEKNYEIIN